MDDVEKPEPDAQEQSQGLDDEDVGSDDVGDEVPEADALEQRRAVSGRGGDVGGRLDEASEGDLVEQSQEAGDDEDDWRG